MYIFAAPLSAYTLYLTVNKYFYNQDIPESIYSILDFLLGSDRQPLGNFFTFILIHSKLKNKFIYFFQNISE